MSTRGLVGFYVDGRPLLAYNHCDSYPSGLGVATLEWLSKRIENKGFHSLRAAATSLTVVVDEDAQPPADVVAELTRKGYSDPGVGGSSDNTEIRTWYQALRHTQGDLDAILDAGYLADKSEFGLDGLFCEWAYVIVLDGDGEFQVYEGFNKTDHDDGLWGKSGPLRPAGWTVDTDQFATYYPVHLIKSWPLFDLPDAEQMHALEASEED